MPVKLVVGQNSNFLIKDINNELCLLFKKHVEQEIKGAGHFLISSHPKDCANAIKLSFFATKSVSQLSDITAPN